MMRQKSEKRTKELEKEERQLARVLYFMDLLNTQRVHVGDWK